MSYKCAICGKSYVENEGDVCDNCLLSLADSGIEMKPQSEEKNGKKYQSKIEQKENTEKEIFYKTESKEKPKKKEKAESTENYIEGIVRNYKEDGMKTSFLGRLFRSMFTWTPFVPDGTIQTFQLFEKLDQRNQDQFEQVCQEVIIYGQIISGTIHENNVVRVKGRRNRHNALEARSVKNLSSGTDIKIRHALHPLTTWILAIIVLLAISYGIKALFGNAGRQLSQFVAQIPFYLGLLSIPMLLFYFMIKSIFPQMSFGIFLKIYLVIIAIILAYTIPILIPLIVLVLIFVFIVTRKKE